jgi:hypothetical protein
LILNHSGIIYKRIYDEDHGLRTYVAAEATNPNAIDPIGFFFASQIAPPAATPTTDGRMILERIDLLGFFEDWNLVGEISDSISASWIDSCSTSYLFSIFSTIYYSWFNLASFSIGAGFNARTFS